MAFGPHSPTQSFEGGNSDDWIDRLKLRIPRYRLVSEISRGGQAIVYRAESEEFPYRVVAVKVLLDGPFADEHARERLQREARVLAVLKSPNIVKPIELGQTDDGRDFLVMDYIDGEPLDKYLSHLDFAASKIDPAALPRLFLKICDAVEEPHKHGIVHRDLSPSNILIDKSGEPHILDFGLARTAFDRFMRLGPNNATVTGQFLGKLAYASPEQARCKPDQIDIRTDVYALGIILYQILTGGQFPYKVIGGIHDILNNIIHATPTPPSDAIKAHEAQRRHASRRIEHRQPGAVNAIIEAIVLKSISKNPSDRYRSAGELAQDIRNYLLGQPTLAKLEPLPRRATSFPTTLWFKLVAGGVSFIAICIVLVWLTGESDSIVPLPNDLMQIAQIVQQAESSTDRTERNLLFKQARTKLEPFKVPNPESKVVLLATHIALGLDDQELAAWASQQYQKTQGVSLQNPTVNEPPIVRLTRLAAEGGDTWSMVQLSLIYEKGTEGASTNTAEAIRWLRKAVEAGSAEAMHLLGGHYAYGTCGIEKDESQAVIWYRRSAEAGSGFGMYMLGGCYQTGSGIAKDSHLAFYWYTQGAKLGDAASMYGLGKLYELGRGVPKDFAKSIEWYRKAASKGMIFAQDELTAKGLTW
jgi:serine/threonine protein kinase